MKRFFKGRKGQKGFTLIELLVVIAILGVLAVIVVPNVVKFIGSGTVDAANTEAHNVQTAVVAYLADNNLVTCNGTVGPGAEDIGTPPTTENPDATTVKSFLINPGALQATYTIAGGAISAASALPDGEWSSLTYTVGNGWG